MTSFYSYNFWINIIIPFLNWIYLYLLHFKVTYNLWKHYIDKWICYTLEYSKNQTLNKPKCIQLTAPAYLYNAKCLCMYKLLNAHWISKCKCPSITRERGSLYFCLCLTIDIVLNIWEYFQHDMYRVTCLQSIVFSVNWSHKCLYQHFPCIWSNFKNHRTAFRAIPY